MQEANQAASDQPSDGSTEPLQARSSTGRTAATYALVGAAQKASGFILLLAFTRFMSTSEYGEIALLTTVGALLLMAMTLGMEPRIMRAYFHIDDGLDNYLRAARFATLAVPVAFSALLALVIWWLPVADPIMWIMECTGACLLTAGTTYHYAILRSTRRSQTYAALALGLLTVQVVGKVSFIVIADWGAIGWAASDLITGIVALLVFPLIARDVRPTSKNGPHFSSWAALRGGLPLVPHYLAQWGLSLSDRLILALFVSTAAIGVYSAIYQITAVISLMLSELNRAFMPQYARSALGSHTLVPLIRSHVKVTFIVFGVIFLSGFAAVEFFLPDAYGRRSDLYPVLALGALLYGLYLIPMNGLTLVAGITKTAPLISLGALSVNVGLNLALDGPAGLWGAAIATCIGYAVLVLLASILECRQRAIPWSDALFSKAWLGFVCLGLIAFSLLSAFPGTTRTISLAGVVILVLSLGISMVPESSKRFRIYAR